MSSELQIITQDGDERTSVSTLPVADIALPTGTAAKVTALVDALTVDSGSGNALLQEAANLREVNFITAQAVIATGVPSLVDNRNVWEFLFLPTVSSDGTVTFKIRMGSRYQTAGNLAAGSKGWKIDTANPPFQSLIAALAAAGVNVKTPYDLTASALLYDAYALVSVRRTNPKKGGLLPAQLGTVTFLEVVVEDNGAPPRRARAQFPITALALPTGYGAKITAVTDALLDTPSAGVALIRADAILRTRIKQNGYLNTAAAPTSGGVQNKMKVQLTATNANSELQSFVGAIGCFNVDYPLTEGKSNQIDPTNQNWIDFVAAMNAFGLVADFDYASTDTIIDGAFSTEQRRKRPTNL